VSASEKLRALERETRAKTSLNYGRVRALNDLEAALPQIVTVVEAAEMEMQALYDSIRPGSTWAMTLEATQLHRALAALDEALS